MNTRKSFVICLAIGILLGISAAVVGLSRVEWEDILGSPSKVPMKRGTQHVRIAQQRHVKASAQYSAKVEEQHRHVLQLIGSSQPKNAIQNLVVKVLNPRNEPVSGLPILATVEKKDATVKTERLVTNAAGRVRLTGITPLPSSVKLAFAPDLKRPDGTPEWTALHPSQTELFMPRGRRMAEASGDGESSQPVVLASLTPFAYYTPVAQRTRAARTTVYEDAVSVTVKRNVVDFELAAPQDARVYRPRANGSSSGGDTIESKDDPVGTVGQDGRLRFQLDAYLFEGGTIPLRLERSVPGGTLEAVVEQYPHDAYAGTNRITDLPPFVLTQVKDIHINRNPDVLASASPVRDALEKRSKCKTTKLPDGSEWWQFNSLGLSVKKRLGGRAFGPQFEGGLVEKIRLEDAKGGVVGGIRVGDDWQEVVTNLGPPQRETSDGAYYLDNGLRFTSLAGKVASIEIARPLSLLTEGTTAFVRRSPLKVFVSEFQGDPRCSVKSLQQFKRYLEQMGAVQIVNSREGADTVFSARTAFEDSKGEFIGTFPYKYEARVRLTYHLQGSSGDLKDDVLDGVSGADYGKEVLGSAIIIGLIDRYLHKQDLPKWQRLLVELALAKLSLDKMRESMGRATRRCPGIAEQAAFNKLSDELYKNADFRATVTSIDYQQGHLVFNTGTADGVVTPGSGRQPAVFELYLGDPTSPKCGKTAWNEGGLKADYYAAEVVAASEHACTAKLVHIHRSVDRSRADIKVTDAPEVVRQIPDPASGIVSGRMRIRFLPLSGDVAG